MTEQAANTDHFIVADLEIGNLDVTVGFFRGDPGGDVDTQLDEEAWTNAIEESHRFEDVNAVRRFLKRVDEWQRVKRKMARHLYAALGLKRVDESQRVKPRKVFVLRRTYARGESRRIIHPTQSLTAKPVEGARYLIGRVTTRGCDMATPARTEYLYLRAGGEVEWRTGADDNCVSFATPSLADAKLRSLQINEHWRDSVMFLFEIAPATEAGVYLWEPAWTQSSALLEEVPNE